MRWLTPKNRTKTRKYRNSIDISYTAVAIQDFVITV